MRIAALASMCVVLAPAFDAAVADETLADAWALALQQNRTLAARRLDVAALGADVDAAWAKRGVVTSLRAGFLHLTDQPAYRGAQPALGVSEFAFPYGQRNSGRVTGRAALPLWTAGRIEASAAAADARRIAGATDAERIQSETLLAVAEAYVAILQAERSGTVAASRQVAADERLKEAIAAEARQRASLRDVLAAESALAAARAGVVKSEHALTDATDAYNRLLGRDRSAGAHLVEPHISRCDEPLEGLIGAVGSRRPEVATLRASAEAFEHLAAALLAERWPHLSAEAGFDYEENRFQSPQTLGSAGVFLDWAATDGGVRLRKARAAATRAAAARARLDEAERSIADEVRAAWRWRDQAAHWITATNEASRLAAERDRWIRRRFQIGAASRVEAADAAAAVAEAEYNCLVARLDGVLAEVRLRQAAGLLDRPLAADVAPHNR